MEIYEISNLKRSRSEESYLNLGVMRNSRLSIFCRYDNLKNTKWVFLHRM